MNWPAVRIPKIIPAKIQATIKKGQNSTIIKESISPSVAEFTIEKIKIPIKRYPINNPDKIKVFTYFNTSGFS